MIEEEWRDIENYEGLYQVSNLGNVKSLNYMHTGREHLLTPGADGGGYLVVSLSKNNKKKTSLVHKLVANAFINKTTFKYVDEQDRLKYVDNLDKLEVNHIIEGEEGKKNNRVDNLEWCTHYYNMLYGTRSKRAGKALSIKVSQLNLDDTFIKEWSSIHEIKRQTRYNESAICLCCQGKHKTAYGFKWKYAD